MLIEYSVFDLYFLGVSTLDRCFAFAFCVLSWRRKFFVFGLLWESGGSSLRAIWEFYDYGGQVGRTKRQYPFSLFTLAGITGINILIILSGI